MNSKIIVAFLLVTISAVLAHPGFARDDAVAPPIAAGQGAVPPVSPSSPAPIPEEQPTSAALLDDATVLPPVTTPVPAVSEGSVPAAEGSAAIPLTI